MKYQAIASDYDDTLALHGVVNPETLAALQRFRQSGRILILVTGRELPDLASAFSQLDLFERVVAENGALVYNPRTRAKRLLGNPLPESFLRKLRQFGVDGMSIGEVVAATWRSHENQILRAIEECGLPLHLAFNKDYVMILPAGIDKSSGLAAALQDLDIPKQKVVGVGDAENDQALLNYCGFSVAVGNAIPSLKETAHLVTHAERGEGVAELIDRIIADDL